MTTLYEDGENEVYLGMAHCLNDFEKLDEDFLFFCDLESFKKNQTIELSLMINLELDLLSVAYNQEIIGSFKETCQALEFKKILEEILKNNIGKKVSETDLKIINQYLQEHGTLTECLLGIDLSEDYTDGIPTVTAHMNYISELAKAQFFQEYEMYCNMQDM